MFVREVVPVLDAHLRPDGYEVHFVGRSEGAPRELVELAAKRPNIKIRGFVDSADEEFLSVDILLALNPIRLGNRLRIASAFSFGCCVVSHVANQCGMPELRHDYNVLLAEKGKDIALAVVRALSDEPLRRRLGENGRKTYENAYSDSACAKIEAHLIRIAGISSR
jgi:glycosyltransferase involved in cell wall biosynthesis